MPEEILETPQPTESKSTDWTKIILAAVFGFALLAASAYAGYRYGAMQSEKSLIQTTDTEKTPTEIARDPLSGTEFQRTLAKCADDAIDLKDLPIVVDTDKVQIRSDKISCMSDHMYLNGKYSDDEVLYIYDKHTHQSFNTPAFGSHGVTLKQTENVRISASLGGTEGPPFIDVLSVRLFGEKRLPIGNTNREVILVSTWQYNAVPATDPRLTSVLNEYAKDSDIAPGRKEIPTDGVPGWDEIELNVIRRFFSEDLKTLEDSERVLIEKVEERLGTVTVR